MKLPFIHRMHMWKKNIVLMNNWYREALSVRHNVECFCLFLSHIYELIQGLELTHKLINMQRMKCHARFSMRMNYDSVNLHCEFMQSIDLLIISRVFNWPQEAREILHRNFQKRIAPPSSNHWQFVSIS